MPVCLCLCACACGSVWLFCVAFALLLLTIAVGNATHSDAIRDQPQLLPLVLKCAPMLQPGVNAAIRDTISGWATGGVWTVLPLLSAAIGTPHARGVAAARLDLVPGRYFATGLLLPALCATAHEPRLDSALARMVLRRGAGDEQVLHTLLSHMAALSVGTAMEARMRAFTQVAIADASQPLRSAWGVQRLACAQLAWVLRGLLSAPRRDHQTALRGLLRHVVLPSDIALPLSSGAAGDLGGLADALLRPAGDSDPPRVDSAQGDDGGDEDNNSFGLPVGPLVLQASYVVDVDATRGGVRAVLAFSNDDEEALGPDDDGNPAGVDRDLSTVLAWVGGRSAMLAAWAHTYVANIVNGMWRRAGVKAWLPRYDMAPTTVHARNDGVDAIQDRLPSQLLALMRVDAASTLLPWAAARAATSAVSAVAGGLAAFVLGGDEGHDVFAVQDNYAASWAGHVVRTCRVHAAGGGW